MQVAMPDSTQVDYLVDGQNRPIGKQVKGNLVQDLLYQDQLSPIAGLDGIQSGKEMTMVIRIPP